MGKRYNLGYFINYDIWMEAISLLNWQLDQKNKKGNLINNKLNFKYFSRVRKDYDKIIDSEEYFNQRIKNNFFYGLNKEFFIYEYGKSKGDFCVRNYFFISYPLMIVHYSIGIYLLYLTQEFMDEIRFGNKEKRKYKINSYYGGDLRVDKGELLFDNGYKRLNYMKYYNCFKDELKRETKDSKNKVILKMDIENYYDNISINKLCYFLNEYIDPITIRKLKFDKYTIDQICFFYEFVMKDNIGVPQSDHNIVSDFIGYLYLLFADISILDEVSSKKIKYSKVIRYVDDIYVVIKYDDNLESKEKLRENAMNILSSISDLLYYKFGLKINYKTGVYLIDNEIEKKKILDNLKKTSVEHVPELMSKNKKTKKIKKKPQEILKEILKEVNKMKEENFVYEYYKNNGKILDTEKLKDIYDEGVLNILDMEEYIEKIGYIFNDFNFDLVRYSPKELILLILKNKSSTERFINFLTEKNGNITINDRDIILELLCQLDYKENRLIELLLSDKYFNKILKEIKSGQVFIEYPGYYSLSFDELSQIYNNNSILQQIELRNLHERKGAYSTALNHLVNEFHSICYNLDKSKKKDGKKYDAINVYDFLLNKVGITLQTKISNLFKTRNINPVSHPGPEGLLFQGVEEEDYNEFKEDVGECLEKLLSNKQEALESI